MELIVLGLFAAAGLASYRLWTRGRRRGDPLEGDAPPRALASGERTLATLQVGDVVQHLGRDYLVEGALTLSEEGRASRLYRLMDGADVRHLWAPHEGDPALLAKVALAVVELSNALEHRGRAYHLRARAVGTALGAGEVSRPPGGRVSWGDYGAGAERVIVLAWEGGGEAFAGERVAPHVLELLPSR